MKRYVRAGVRPDNDSYIIDYTYNYPDDLIYIEEPQLYQSVHDTDIYYFGYRFTEQADSVARTDFIRSVKQLGDGSLTDTQLDQFIKRPLKHLDKYVRLSDIDCMVYPLSNRSPLVKKMIRAINDMTQHDMSRCSFEMVKQAPVDIGFDFESFESDHADDAGYSDMLKYVKKQLMPAIQKLDYFSIAQNVKSKYRPYITGYLNFKNSEDIERFSKLQGANILVVDDINTTGSTLHEILRKLSKLNSDCNIYVYTLIGN